MPVSHPPRLRAPVIAAIVAAILLALVGTGPAGAAPEARTRVVVIYRDRPGSLTAAERQARVAAHQAIVTRTYSHGLTGFAGSVPVSQVARLRADPNVAAVAPDVRVHALGTQTGATWGLDRIDQRTGTDGRYSWTSAGSGVTAYVIDTGIATGNSDFGGRARLGYDALTAGLIDDCNGHGTHVAGTIGGTKYGVAKSVSLVAVRVLDCVGSGLSSQVVAGIDWVAGDHDPGEPAVANMSLGGGGNAAIDAAVKRAIADGVTFAVAAGNDSANACSGSPSRVPKALTVAATQQSDAPASFTNFGSCVDLYAPGVNITSDWIGGANATNTISGTSMATPHVTGVAALYLATSPGASPATVSTAVLSRTTKDAVPDSRSSANDLLFTNL
jgi:subtilisin family serine protease